MCTLGSGVRLAPFAEPPIIAARHVMAVAGDLLAVGARAQIVVHGGVDVRVGVKRRHVGVRLAPFAAPSIIGGRHVMKIPSPASRVATVSAPSTASNRIRLGGMDQNGPRVRVRKIVSEPPTESIRYMRVWRWEWSR